MKVYLKSDRPLRLATIAALCRELDAMSGQGATVPARSEEQQDAWVEQLMEEAAPFGEHVSPAMWEQEVQALRQLTAERYAAVEWLLAPLAVPLRLPAIQYALLAGFTIHEGAASDEWLSPLALVWLKAVGAKSMTGHQMQVGQVAVFDDAVLIIEREAGQPSVLREVRHHEKEHIDEGMMLVQVNLDDCSPEWLAYAMERLFAAGANDVSALPLTMKKSRLGSMLQVLCYESALEAVKTILFEETTTFGIRYFPVAVHRLGRRLETVNTRYGEVSVKLGYHRGKRVQCAPEYDMCARRAKEAGVPIGEVYAEAKQLGQLLAAD